MKPIRGMDLFASAGGLTIGLKAAGVCTVCAIEKDPHRVATFARHTPGAALLTGDIRQMSLSAYKGRIELVYGGPPCQPFSSGGLRQAASDDRDMIPEFVRVIQEVEPEAFLMENVPGLAIGDRLAYFSRIIESLENQGFNVNWQVLNAADYGVPQRRRRLFVVGLRQARFCFPEPTHGSRRQYPHVAVRDVLPLSQLGEPNLSKVFYAKNPDLRPSPFDGHLFNGGGRPIDCTKPCHTILASAGGNKTHFFDEGNLVSAYHRHLMAGGAPKVGSLPGARRITVVESALLQTFPAETVFCGPRSSQYHQVGDAVPPRLAEVLGQALLAQIREDSADTEILARRLGQRTLFS